MVRKRGKARRSYGIKRGKKYRIKVDPRLISLRFKERIDPMATNTKWWLTLLDAVEKEIFPLLVKYKIPTEEFVNYIASAKRMFSKITRFRALTLFNEILNWISVYVTRGLKREALQDFVDPLERLWATWGLVIVDYLRYEVLAIVPETKEQILDAKNFFNYFINIPVGPGVLPQPPLPPAPPFYDKFVSYIYETTIPTTKEIKYDVPFDVKAFGDVFPTNLLSYYKWFNYFYLISTPTQKTQILDKFFNLLLNPASITPPLPPYVPPMFILNPIAYIYKSDLAIFTLSAYPIVTQPISDVKIPTMQQQTEPTPINELASIGLASFKQTILSKNLLNYLINFPTGSGVPPTPSGKPAIIYDNFTSTYPTKSFGLQQNIQPAFIKALFVANLANLKQTTLSNNFLSYRITVSAG